MSDNNKKRSTSGFKKLIKDPILFITIIAVIISLFVFIVLPLYQVLKQ